MQPVFQQNSHRRSVRHAELLAVRARVSSQRPFLTGGGFLVLVISCGRDAAKLFPQFPGTGCFLPLAVSYRRPFPVAGRFLRLAHHPFDLIQHFKAVGQKQSLQPNKRARKLTYMQTSLHTCLHACTPTYIHVRSSIQCANARMSRHSIYITTCVLLRVHKCLSCPRLSASLFLLSSQKPPKAISRASSSCVL